MVRTGGKTKTSPSRINHIIMVGTGGVGKSALTVRFVQKFYDEQYNPTIEDSYTKDVIMDGNTYPVEILDTAGADQFTAMKDTYMKMGNGFVLVYSIANQSSLDELEEIRDEILRIKDLENVPMVLVGNKCDLVEGRVVSEAAGKAMSAKFGGCPIIEASAKQDINVETIFHQVLTIILDSQKFEKTEDTTTCKCAML